VHGTGPNVGAAITAHPKINTISFTGGTVTGRKVAEACAPLFKKVSLELGGKTRNIIFADADLDAHYGKRTFFVRKPGTGLSVRLARVRRAFCLQGFRRAFHREGSQLKMGDPLDQKTDQGAIASKTQLEKIKFYVDLAQKEGGKVVLGGKAPESITNVAAMGISFSRL